MYSKYLVVASRKDKAGYNIVLQLTQFGKYEVYIVDEEIIYTESLKKEIIEQFDFIIFASKHESEKQVKTLSLHAPGNWKTADYGGVKGKVCKSSAVFQKQMFEKLKENAEEHNLKGYEITLECTHHGPLIDKPCVFIEIGATEREWRDPKASFVVAKTIHQMISEFKENKYNEIGIGIGGPHYCPNFNKIQMESNVAISHIIPEYALPLTEELLKEAIAKTEEEVDFAIIDWKGVGRAEERDKMLKILEQNYIQYKRTSEIK
ncbi:D-aminoacyl-tRNA deacylase [uncultured archaeon]|nr:D-aminoacyl-tRNA deacylase [uncultured archaeon]